MKIAAIITEYNPFHNGHLYQIERTRELLGEDTAIVAIMSGNYTQRGEPAIADKTIRARAAVECGVNLVLELPFPYSMSSAEFFARGGIYIADKIGVVDYLVFGSENGNIDALNVIATNLSSKEYAQAFENIKRSDISSALGYPEMCELAYNELFSPRLTRDFFTPNNILALEYLKALRNIKSNITPVTIKRAVAGYNDNFIVESSIQSATAIRQSIAAGDPSALDFVPENAKKVFSESILSGKMPTSASKFDTAVISHFRLNPTAAYDIHDASGGLYNRLSAASVKTDSISSLTSMTSTKKYTAARIRRAIWNSYFGVTSSDVRAYPKFTQVLATDSIGRSILKRIKKTDGFYIITKPSAYKTLPDDVVKQKELSNRADSVFTLMQTSPNDGNFPLTFTPYVK